MQRYHCEKPPLTQSIHSAALQHQMAVLSSVAQQVFHLRDYYFCSARRQSNVLRLSSYIYIAFVYGLQKKNTSERKLMTEVNASI